MEGGGGEGAKLDAARVRGGEGGRELGREDLIEREEIEKKERIKKKERRMKNEED